MVKAISINIGLNGVNPDCYNGWDGALSGCLNDANAMQAIADGLGYMSIPIHDSDATADRVIGEIGQAAANLDEGGILFLSYSGHGGQVPDDTGTEDDGKCETWVLYDRQLIDKELYGLWSNFKTGSRIFVVSDSCHSGTVTRQLEYQARPKALERYRFIPPQISQANFQANRAHYRALQFANMNKKRDMIESTVLLISGCQDNQLSGDGDTNGVFTGNLLKVWNDGSFSNSYKQFYSSILNLMPSDQTPNYLVVGADNPSFEAQTPFTTDTRSMVVPNSNGAWPTVSAPSSASRKVSPKFTVNPGPGRYYAFEAAADPALFNTAGNRRSDNFFATWSDQGFLNAPTYAIPDAAWSNISKSNKIFYRVLSNDNPSRWNNWVASDAKSAAPSVQLTA